LTVSCRCRHTLLRFAGPDSTTWSSYVHSVGQRSLPAQATKTLVQAFISCRLDYCNSFPYGVTDKLMRQVQSVQPPRSTRSSSVVTLSRPPTISHWKSQIAHSDMHHPVCGINSRILSVSLASQVSTHLLIHLSAHLCYHHHSHHPEFITLWN